MYNQGGGKFALQTTDSSGTDFALLIFIRNSSSDAGNNTVKTSRILTEGNWYNVIFSFNSGSCQFYINGSPVTTTITGTIPSNLMNVNGNLNIGKFGGSLTRYWNGKISNLSVWNTALTSTQVTEIYNEGVPSNLNNHSAYSNLVSWWQLGSNSSFNTNWTVLDEKGSNNGTSQNMGEDAIVDGVNSYANGVSSGMSDNIVGSAPFSDANSLSYNMDVLDRSTDVPN